MTLADNGDDHVKVDNEQEDIYGTKTLRQARQRHDTTEERGNCV